MSGWDTFQEAYHASLPRPLAEKLDAAKAEAQAARMNGEGVAKTVLGNRAYLIHATGAAGGVAYRLETDDLLYLLRSPDCEWGVSVRYLSAGLWERGLEDLRAEARDFINAHLACHGEEHRTSRADFAFDFLAPGLSGDFQGAALRDLLVCHSSSKARVHMKAAPKDHLGDIYYMGTSARDQTLTVGKVSNIQITVYNKGDEITEMSGKTWMADLWAQANDGIYPEDEEGRLRHMWRLEVRMGGDFLKARNVHKGDLVTDYRGELLADALHRVRIVAPEGEACLRNRPLHPIFSAAVEASGGKLALPIGRRVTGRREELLDRQAAQIAGSLRSASILGTGGTDDAALNDLVRRVRRIMAEDPEAARKDRAVRDRIEFVDEAK